MSHNIESHITITTYIACIEPSCWNIQSFWRCQRTQRHNFEKFCTYGTRRDLFTWTPLVNTVLYKSSWWQQKQVKMLWREAEQGAFVWEDVWWDTDQTLTSGQSLTTSQTLPILRLSYVTRTCLQDLCLLLGVLSLVLVISLLVTFLDCKKLGYTSD